MMGTKVYDNALDLITFSRNSGGTSLRKISYGDELVTNGTFDTDVSGWNAYLSATISWDAGRIKAVKSASYGGFNQSLSGLVVGKVYTVYAELEIINFTSAQLWISEFSGGLDIAVKTLGAGLNIYSFQFVATATTMWINARGNVVSGTGTIYGDNISVKEVLFDQPDGTLQLFTHPADIPRIDYSPDGTAKGLLIEEQRTNLVTYSEDFSNVAWVKTQCSAVNISAVTDPSGGTSAELVTATAGTASKFLRQNLIVPSTVTFSVYVKNDTQRYIQLVSDGDVEAYANFDILAGAGQTGTKGTKTTSSIIDVGNGWYRCSATFTNATSGVSVRVFFVDSSSASWFSSSTGTGTYYIYGAQLEAGAFPTSYIPTSGSTVTRAADVASIPVSAFGYNQSAGTIIVEFDSNSLNNSGIYSLESSSTKGITALVYPANRVTYQVLNGTFQVNLNFDAYSVAGQISKIATTYKTNDFASVLDGGTVALDSSGSVPLATVLRLGDYTGGSASFDMSGHIKSIQYFPRRLTNAQLQELTT